MSSDPLALASLDLPDLPLGWHWTQLRELVDPSRGVCYGIVQPGAHDQSGVPMVNTGDVFDGHAAVDIHFRVSQQLHAKFRRSTLRGGELLVTLVGANFGRVAIAPDGFAGYNCSRAVGVVPVLEDPEYVMFALRSPLSRHFMDSWANTTAQPTFNLKELGCLPVPVAPAKSRVAIKTLLCALDDRIALLRGTNATLEAIAQALFKSWFVDFDPVRAKQQGLSPAGMDEATAALFPDSFEESALGLMPKGWSVQPVGDAVECVGGATPDTKDPSYWSPEEHAWTTPKDLSGLPAPVLLSTERRLSTKGVAKIGSGLLPVGTLLMSSRAPIGYLAIAQLPAAINQGYIAMPPGSLLPPLYMLFWCRQNMEGIKARANGSTFMEISKKAFRPIPALVPSSPAIEAFLALASPLFARLVSNEQQAQSLATLRDTLLPRLISGQLRLPEALVEMEEAA